MNQKEIIVPTTEVLKQKHILKMFVGASKPLLFVGSTGTGKTLAITQFIREIEKEKFDALTICFSAKTSANFTQKQVEEKLVTRKRRHLGPANGRRLIVFIDDLNMPSVEKEGA
jgi:dynein heavy chain